MVFRLLALYLFIGTALIGAPSHAASCLKDQRTFPMAEGEALKLRDYLCRSESANLRVQFHRVNDLTFGTIMSAAIPDALEPLFGNGRLIENEVYREWASLLDKFGEEESTDATLSVFAAGDRDANMRLSTQQAAKVRVLVAGQGNNPAPDFPGETSVILALLRAETPRGFRKSLDKKYSRDIYWRYMTSSDLKNYKKTLREWNKLILRDSNLRDREFQEIADHKYFSLLQHLGRHGWPETFVPINTSYNECGGWEFSVYVQMPLIDLMVIENAGSAQIEISALLGSRSDSLALRPQSQSRSLQTAPVAEIAVDGSLAPGERLLVPTRIAFAVPDGLRTHYDGIRGGPKLENYVYGPELAIKGMIAGGERIDLDEQSANFLALTTSCDCGSCPYLYAWDASRERWRKHGKVIHKAQGRAAQETETVSFDGLVSRYRLAEEEAELAYIDEVSLRLEFEDGTSLALAPGQAALSATDDSYVHILFGEAVDVDFEIPAGVDRSRITKSHVSITGYYRRYSEIMTLAHRPLQLIGAGGVRGAAADR